MPKIPTNFSKIEKAYMYIVAYIFYIYKKIAINWKIGLSKDFLKSVKNGPILKYVT